MQALLFTLFTKKGRPTDVMDGMHYATHCGTKASIGNNAAVTSVRE